MKLQHKAWALVLAILSLAALGSMLGVRELVVDSFETLEAEGAGREGNVRAACWTSNSPIWA